MLKRFFFWFLVFFAIFFFVQSFTTKKQEPTEKPDGIYLTVAKDKFKTGEFVTVTVHNGGTKPALVKDECPSEPFDVYRREKSTWVQIENTGEHVSCEGDVTLQPGEARTLSYAPWNYALFQVPGEYKLELVLADNVGGEDVSRTADVFFEIAKKGIFGIVWNEGLYRPIYNLLIFFMKVLPNHSFALAIILLTLIIRLALLLPNQKALRSQREMQKIQPELDAIKRKFEGNQEMIAKKTMELWKQHKVNPMGSCLPLLIQLPILIALFYVAQNGLNPFNTHLLYESLRSFDLTLIDTNFLWLDLAKVDRYILPLTVGLLQFVQMKLVSAGLKKPEKKKDEKKGMADAMQNMNTVMTYFMPVMIAIMTASFPSGVGLYWGFSTMFGIGQQIVVNRERKRKKQDDKNDIQVIDVTSNP